MTDSALAMTVRLGLSILVSATLGVLGVLDPTHAMLLGCGFVAVALLSSRVPDAADPGWPQLPFRTHAGGRSAVSDLSRRSFDLDGRVRPEVVARTRALAKGRLALLGVDIDDPAQHADVERLLGAPLAAGLATQQHPTARTLQTWLDAIDRLSDERTTP